MQRIPLSDIKEYALLGKMQTECLSSRELWKHWFQILCEKAEDHAAKKELIQCIDDALQSASIETIEEPDGLLRLVECLLGRLSKGSASRVTRENYRLHCLTLFTVHQTFVIIRRLAPRCLDVDDEGGLYRRFKGLLKNISEDRTYYPYRYQARLIRQSLGSMKIDGAEVSIMDGCRRFFFGGYGNVAAIREVHVLRDVDFDYDTCKAALKNAVTGMTVEQASDTEYAPWYDSLLEVYKTSLRCIRDPKSFAAFETCCRLNGDKAAMMQTEDRKAFRFGLVDHLRMLSLHGATLTVQSEALRMLVSLGKRCRSERSGWEGWAEDVEVFEALLDALHALYLEVEEEEAAVIVGALQSMTAIGARIELRKKIDAWLDGNSLDERLLDRPLVEPSPVSDRLFREATRRIHALSRQKKMEDLHKELKVAYQLTEFTIPKPLFEDRSPRHVRTLHFHLTRLAFERNDHSREGTAAQQIDRPVDDHSALHLQDLFKSRKVGESKVAHRTRKVLIVGDPGTGKTLLSRKIAYLWSMGEWGSNFEALYLLPASKLSARAYDASDTRREKTLATAIANTCFSPRDDLAEYEELRAFITKDLKKSKSLVIVDGGFEVAEKVCEEILQEAKDSHAALLAFSRPCAIQANRFWPDMHIECKGFDDKQLATFIGNELPKDKARSLKQLLLTNDTLKKIAHVPANAHILCRIWNERPEILDADGQNGTISSLYRKLSSYLWDLFVEKHKPREITRSDMFDALGTLGFDALDREQFAIGTTCVHEQFKDPTLQALLKQNAFLLLQFNAPVYKFPHSSFQEYFAGCHLARKLYEGGSAAKRVANFIAKNKYNAEFQRTFVFMMEEVGRTQSCEGFKKIVAMVDAAPLEVFGFQHALLRLRFVESFLAVTKKKGHHEMRFIDTTEPVVRSIMDFMVSLWEKRILKSTISKAFSRAPNVCQAFATCAELHSRISQERDAPPSQTESFLATHQSSVSLTSPRQQAGPSTKHVTTADVESSSKGRVNKRVMLTASKSTLNAKGTTVTLLSSHHCQESSCHASTSQGQQEGAYRDQARLERLTASVLHLLSTAETSDEGSHADGSPEHPSDHMLSIARCIDSLLERMPPKDRSLFLRHIPQCIKEDPDNAARFLYLHSILLECRQPETRETALEQIPKLIDLCPDHMDDLLDLISRHITSDHHGIRTTAVRQLCTVIQSMPHCADVAVDILPQIRMDTAPTALRRIASQLPTLISHCRGRTRDILRFHSDLAHSSQINVCELAVKLIPKLIKLCPYDDAMLIDQLTSQLKSNRFEIRAASVDQMLVLLETSPQHSEQLMRAFLEVEWDEMGYYACMSVIKQMPNIVTAFPEHSASLLHLQEHFLEMKDVKIRSATLEYIVAWIEGCPEHADALLDVFLRSDRSTSVDVRRKAMQQIPYLVKKYHRRRNELLRLKFRLFEAEHPTTRAAAVAKIAGWIRCLPENADTLIDILLASYHDVSAHVRCHVVSQIMEIREDWPKRAEALNYIGWKACEDQDEGVRLAHVAQLLVALRRSPSQQETHCIEQAARLLKDEASRVRDTLIAGFKSLPLQTLFRLYLEENNSAVIRSIVPRLPHVALSTVRIRNKPDAMMLMLHVGPWKRIQWERPVAEIESVVLVLKREIDRCFPGFARKGDLNVRKS